MQTRAEQLESITRVLLQHQEEIVAAGYKIAWEQLEKLKKEAKQMSKFTAGDKVVSVPADHWFKGVGKLESGSDSCWDVVHAMGEIKLSWEALAPYKPQFKKGDKLRLIDGELLELYRPGPWKFFYESNGKAGVAHIGYNDDPPHASHEIIPITSFELWNKQEKPIFIEDAEDDLHIYNKADVVETLRAASQLQHKPINCAICDKEYSGPEQAYGPSIIGGGNWASPVPSESARSESMKIGPCCARKVDAFILDLKTNRTPDTDRKNATNSWMPHDEEGNL